MRSATRLGVFGGLVILIGLSIYLPGLSGPLFFDDLPALSANKLAQIDGSSFDEWRVAAFSSHAGLLRRPIAMLSFTANYVFSAGFDPVGLKAVNLAIHLLIALLLYFFSSAVLDTLAIGRDSFTRNLIALTAAGIWLLHPLHVSTVLYAVQRMAQLAALFTLAGLYVFVRYRQRWAKHGASIGEVVAAALWLLLLTALAVLSKESGALLPWLIIVIEVVVFRGVWAGRGNSYLQCLGWVLLFLPLCLVLLLFAVSPETLTAGFAGREFSLEQRLLTQARMLWRYLGWLWVPNINDLGFQHDDIPLSRGLFDPATTILALVAWPVSLLLAIFFRRRYPLLLLALLFFCVGHSMESSVIALEMVYEHRNYLPSMMVCLSIAALLVIPATARARISVWYPVLGVFFILGLLLLIRVQTWSDELTLTRVDVDNHPESSRANYFYGNALLRRYAQRKQLALDEQEIGETLLLSRHYFERMYQANNRDVAALVMLYYLDSRFFVELHDRVNWLAELESLLETRTLQASDWNALDTLIHCFATGPCDAGRAQVLDLLDRLAARYPDSVTPLKLRYLYLAPANEKSDQLLPLLEQAQQRNPGALWVYSSLLSEHGRRGDVANMYETARLWLLSDRQRLYLPLAKAVFAKGEGDDGPSDD